MGQIILHHTLSLSLTDFVLFDVRYMQIAQYPADIHD